MDKKRLKLGSLFSGSGGFELAGCLHGIEPVWSSEIEKFCLRVEALRFPNCKQLGSVTDINGAEVEPVDIITWGSPCQDLSVAGKQSGLSGARSELYVEAVRIIKEMYDATNGEYPKFGIFENVPGLLSSNKGNDFIAAMDMMQGIGFLPDPNIIDAQYFGVPQRRKRVYIAWANVNYILKQRTDLSRNITLQLLTELLQSNLAGLLRVLGNGQKDLDALPRKLSADGAKKRIKLFSLQQEENLLTLQKNLDAIQAIYQKERGNWESKIGEGQTEPITLITMAMPLNPLTMEFQDGYIGQLLKQALDDRCEMEKSSIISTLTNSTIAEKISFYFQALANISNVIGVYINFLAKTSPYKLTHCEWAKSFLTEMKVFINAANRHEKSVGHVGWDDDVRFCERSVSACTKYLIADFGSERAGEILFERESVRGDSAESGEAREGTAADAQGSAGRSDSVVGCGLYNGQLTGDKAATLGANSGASANHAGSSVCYQNETAYAWTYRGRENGCNVEMQKDVSYCLREPSGGGSQPNVCYKADGVKCLNPWDCQSKRQYSVDGVYRTLDAGNCAGGQVHGVVYPINTMVATRGGKDDMRTCFGIGEPNDPQFTISAAHEHGVCYAVEGNTVDRTSNKNGKGYCEDVSPTLNTQDKHAVTYAIEGNGQRESHQGDGYAETDKMYTLNTIERHAVCFQQNQRDEVRNMGEQAGALTAESGTHNQNYLCYPDKARSLCARHDSSPCVDRGQNVVAIDCRNMAVNEELSATIQAKNQGGHSLNYINPIVYDCRGNGDGKTVPTLTGDHQNRVTDYTSCCVARCQSMSDYTVDGTCSTLKERDYKGGAVDVVLEKKPPRKYIVRRLTPTECLRLQGLPDWWIDGANGSDSAIYKMAGNGIAIPCAEDVLGRIARALREDNV